MRIVQTLTGVAALVLSAAAYAAPTYLVCGVPNPDVTPFRLTMDEENSRVIFFNPTSGFRQVMLANYTQDRVQFGDRMITYSLSRIDLSLDRTINILRETERGSCRIDHPAPKRAF